MPTDIEHRLKIMCTLKHHMYPEKEKVQSESQTCVYSMSVETCYFSTCGVNKIYIFTIHPKRLKTTYYLILKLFQKLFFFILHKN